MHNEAIIFIGLCLTFFALERLSASISSIQSIRSVCGTSPICQPRFASEDFTILASTRRSIPRQTFTRGRLAQNSADTTWMMLTSDEDHFAVNLDLDRDEWIGLGLLSSSVVSKHSTLHYNCSGSFMKARSWLQTPDHWRWKMQGDTPSQIPSLSRNPTSQFHLGRMSLNVRLTGVDQRVGQLELFRRLMCFNSPSAAKFRGV